MSRKVNQNSQTLYPLQKWWKIYKKYLKEYNELYHYNFSAACSFYTAWIILFVVHLVQENEKTAVNSAS